MIDFYTEAAFIYWKAQVNGLSDVIELSSSNKLRGPDFNWGAGFSVELGYKIPHDEWKIALQVTSYRMHSTTGVQSSEGVELVPVWTTPFQNLQKKLLQVDQHYRLHLGVVDLLLSRSILASASIDLTPYMGLSFASVRQKYHFDYSFSNDSDSWRMKNKFEGMGPAIGCLAEIFLGKGFFLCGDASVRLLYGGFYTHQGERSLSSQVKKVRLFNDFHVLEAALAGSVGVGWQSPHWKIEMGYDQMLFMAQNQLPYFMSSSSPGVIKVGQGDLSLLGVHLTGGFNF